MSPRIFVVDDSPINALNRGGRILDVCRDAR
jgi:hypothetical protein